MNLLTQNAKLKKTSEINKMRILNFSLPAYKTINNKTICPFAKDCIKYCYAQKGNYKYPSVIKGLNNRYELSKTADFVPQMNATIILQRPTHVRIHDSGDFYSIAYLLKWVNIANTNKDVIFYAYTKSIPFFKGTFQGKPIIKIPKNLKIIFSEGSKRDILINNNKDRHARIFKDVTALLKAGYINASDNDLNAIQDNKKVGLVYH
tara:strand:- start:2965 stop:3582 length:618 start_codon:yes stop_codon:yes gene_type:complete